MDLNELMWNFAKQEDVLINDMSVAQDRASAKMKVLMKLMSGHQLAAEGD